MNNRGYFYTFVTVIMIFMLLSLTLFYFKVSKPKMTDILTNIQTDELHFFVESIKRDFSKAMIISGQRAATFLINKDRPLTGYVEQCDDFDYYGIGAEAALAELIYCGSFEGDYTESGDVMGNYSTINWTERVIEFGDTLGYTVYLNITSIKILPFGAFKFAILGNIELSAQDKNNISFYSGQFESMAIVPIRVLNDPMFLFNTNEYDLLHNITPCELFVVANASVVDDWIDNECYFSSNYTYDAPPFFDRLENNTNLTEHYQEEAEALAWKMGNERLSIIGLETLVNLDRFWDDHGIPGNRENSWVDYLYWQDIRGACTVSGMTEHPDFHINPEHALKYNLTDLNCGVMVYNDGGTDVFVPDGITLPVNSNIRWWSDDGYDDRHAILEDGTVVLGEVYTGNDVIRQFTTEGTYTYTCNSLGHISPSMQVDVIGRGVRICSSYYPCDVADDVCVQNFGLSCDDPNCGVVIPCVAGNPCENCNIPEDKRSSCCPNLQNWEADDFELY